MHFFRLLVDELVSSLLTFVFGIASLFALFHAVAVSMDVILEVFDTFAFDRFWATVLPAQQEIAKHNVSATFSSMRHGATLIPQQSWVYEPATKYFSFQPTEYAWQSAWPRDRIERQFVELFLITW